MRRFGGDPSVVGRSFTHDNRAFEIIGVTAKGFTGIEPGRSIDLWRGSHRRAERSDRTLDVS